MGISLRTSEFCNLARNTKWQEWLNANSPELYADLTKTLQNPKGGCKKNTAKMIEIKDKLHKLGKDDILIEFLSKEFPNVLEKQALILKKDVQKQKINNLHTTSIDANKHKVFAMYNPSILTFPQKFIIIDKDTKTLQKRVKHFLSNKVKSDYIIIDDRAYIEYFLPRFKKEAETFPDSMRELHNWRLKNSTQ